MDLPKSPVLKLTSAHCIADRGICDLGTTYPHA